ncbi:BglII/BstYI family type II restriction endonuclease [Desulforamulus ferrireducens]|uniref:Restriction endonuclease n=1 Tax=Desulforamulus ferrireducens TaxID=1833852 RepID=A0A1S6IVT4_9FIRM|nr:BglII/BstYI family type II restriction endonuclease [Desulforamulus ferrireducens]AQS58886.1 restriction endonuclease [Desulforamulus ferrireducens]
MRLTLREISYRSASEFLDDTALRNEINQILLHPDTDLSSLSRVQFNHILMNRFKESGWQSYPSLFHEPVNPFAKIELIKEDIGLEIGFRHASHIGHNLLKFQLSAAHNSDTIKVGIFVVTTTNFQKQMKMQFNQNWSGSMNYEKVERYLRNFKRTFVMPICLIGIDVA